MSNAIKFVCLLVGFACFSCNSEESKAWKKVNENYSLAAVDDFLVNYPESSYKKKALKSKEEMLWAIAKRNNTVYFFEEYKNQFPKGSHIDSVQFYLDNISYQAPSLVDLSTATFVGTVLFDKDDKSVLCIKFSSITDDESSDDLQFIAAINTNKFRKDVTGKISKLTGEIVFDTDENDSYVLNLGSGQIYNRPNAIFIESTNLNRYWEVIGH